MQEREHTLCELAKMEKVRSHLLTNNILDKDSFDDYMSELIWYRKGGIYERSNRTTEGASVTYSIKMEGKSRVEAAEQIVVAALPAYCSENAWEDGWTGINSETIGRTDGM